MEVRVELDSRGIEACAIIGPGAVRLESLAARVFVELMRLGVRGANQAQVHSCLAAAAQDADLGTTWKAVVAQGEAPQNGLPKRLEPLFPVIDTPLGEADDPLLVYPQNVVYPGDVIGEVRPAFEGVPGRSLMGTAIPASRGTEVPIAVGSGVLQDGTALLRSDAYGVALHHRHRLSVAPAIRVSEDLMEARITILPDPSRNPAEHFERLIKALFDLGIRHGIQQDALREAVQACSANQAPVGDVLAARGRAAVDGEEEDFRLVLDLKKKLFGDRDGERVDYLEMETVKNVRRGEVIAERIPPRPPEPGYRIDGSPLKPGLRRRTSTISRGENTVLSEDGKAVLADADGMVVVHKGKFHVVDQYIIDGNVDLSTGNIRASGAVTVRGQVKPGLLIQAGREVEVVEDVCKAVIESEGGVRVLGAISAGSRVSAGKNVAARYILNSRIDAGGDVEVALSVTGSQVYARGRLRVTGPGVILGGEVNAARGIEARTIGAPSSRTRVVVGVNLKDVQELEALRAGQSSIAAELKALQSSLGREFLMDPKRALLALPPVLRTGKLQVLKKMQELKRREGDLQTREEELSRGLAEVQDAKILVSGEIYAGTVVMIGNSKSVLSETLHHVMLLSDAKTNSVVYRRI